MKITDHIDLERFQRAWTDRFDPEKALLWDRELALTPAAQAQTAPGALAGLAEMPLLRGINNVYVGYEYVGWMEECRSISETCYIGDWSWLYKFRIKGPDALKCLASTTINNYDNFAIGQGKHIISVRPDGKMIGEGIAFRLGDDEILCTGGIPMREGLMLNTAGFDVEGGDCSSTEYNFHVQGPNSLFVLEKLTGESLRDIKFARFRYATVAGTRVRIYRSGMSGELGYELHGSPAHASVVWSAVFEAGQEFGIQQLGFRSMMVNHLEAYFPTQFIDYTPAIFPPEAEDQFGPFYRSPVEMGWANRIDATRDFAGKDALLAEIREPKATMVTLEWNDEDTLKIFASLFDKEGEPFDQPALPVSTSGTHFTYAMPIVTPDGDAAGLSMNRGYSAHYRRFLSLAHLDIRHAKDGTELVVLYGKPGGPQLPIRATVRPAPYKKLNNKVDVRSLPGPVLVA